jgi:putative flippase GtrA
MLARASVIPWAPVRFALVGVVNTLASLSVVYLLMWVFHAHEIVANVVGYAAGLCISYLLNARWTFEFRGSLGRALPRFALTVAAAYAANLVTVCVALYALHTSGYVAQAAGVIPYAVVSYFGSKLFVFVEPSPS